MWFPVYDCLRQNIINWETLNWLGSGHCNNNQQNFWMVFMHVTQEPEECRFTIARSIFEKTTLYKRLQDLIAWWTFSINLNSFQKILLFGRCSHKAKFMNLKFLLPRIDMIQILPVRYLMHLNLNLNNHKSTRNSTVAYYYTVN